jgi:arabinose-5-phosphate isomerase
MNLENIIESQKNNIDDFFSKLDINQIKNFCNILMNVNNGTIIFYGIGKSENVSIHFSSLLNSIGIKSVSLSSQNCLHGDIGFINNNDYVIYISNSGNTYELLNIAPYISSKTPHIYGIFSNNSAKLLQYCKSSLILPKVIEIDKFNSIPTTSIIEYITIINIMISYIIEIKHININSYSLNHPEGSIGKRLYKNASDIMINCDNISIIKSDTTIKECLLDICSKHVRCSVIVSDNNRIIGLITDGDLRRYLSEQKCDLNDKIYNCANFNPIYVNSDIKAIDVINLVKNDYRLLSGVPVVNQNKELIGLITQQQIIDYSL